MDNWVLVPCHNNSALLTAALESVLAQTIPVRIFAIDNASKDNTPFVLSTLDNRHIAARFNPQLGVAGAWNFGLKYLFNKEKAERVLVINQDVVLRPDTYAILRRNGKGFITAVSTGNKRNNSLDVKVHTGQGGRVWNKRNNPDFSCFLIERDCYRNVGLFDEAFYPAWFEDNDYHIRMGRAGITATCIDLPFYHYAAGTMKNASDEDRANIYNPGFLCSKQYFQSKWGVLPGTKQYEAMCSPDYWTNKGELNEETNYFDGGYADGVCY